MLGIAAPYGRPMPKNRDRAADSRRLKAARWLAGKDRRNKRGQLIALPVTELAEMEPLKRNRISASRLEEIEQERTEARDMELEKVAEALGLPTSFLLEGSPATPEDRVAEELGLLRKQVDDLAVSLSSGERTTAQGDLEDALREMADQLHAEQVRRRGQGEVDPGAAGGRP